MLAAICFVAASPQSVRDKMKIRMLKPVHLRLGLDLQGGSHIAYEADLSKFKDVSEKERAMESLRNVVDKRVNALGVAEPNIYTTKFGDNRRIIIELPGIDVNQAKDLIGKTAKMKFKTQMNEEGTMWQDTDLEGKNLKKATVQNDPQTNSPEVAIEFDSEGATKFGDLTKNNLGKRIGIFLDDEIVSAPTVQAEIRDGHAVISGKFDYKEANDLKIQLNAGALPVDIKLVEERTVGETLGQESVRKSFFAGTIALLVIFMFMTIYYRFPGFIASVALGIYTLIVIAIFKGAFYIFPPVTLTLAGIAAFILSIGMAVDANILIFERMKEEFRLGKGYGAALDAGFKRAWPSIKDSNIATFITCAILMAFGSTVIKGFAYTLLIGVAVSMFTAITITRTFLKAFINTRISKNPKLFGFAIEKGEK